MLKQDINYCCLPVIPDTTENCYYCEAESKFGTQAVFKEKGSINFSIMLNR